MSFPPVYSFTLGVAQSVDTQIGKLIVRKPPQAKRACHWCLARGDHQWWAVFFDSYNLGVLELNTTRQICCLVGFLIPVKKAHFLD